MFLPFTDLKSQSVAVESYIRARIDQVLDHGQYIMGPKVAELEQKLLEYMVILERREEVREKLSVSGVPTAVHYPVPLNEQPAYNKPCCLEWTLVASFRIVACHEPADVT